MTMPTYLSAISFAQLQAEFGGAATNISLSNYYSGGTNVPASTIAYPTGGGPTGAGYVYIPSSGALGLKDFCAGAKLTTATYDLQYGTRTMDTTLTGTWTIPRLIVGNITITVIGGGGGGAGGPSAAAGGSGGGGALRVIPGSALLSLGLPGSTIAYGAGNRGFENPRGSFTNPSDSYFGTSGQEWYIVGGRGQNANEGNNNNTGGGPGGTGSGTTPTYGTLTTGTGGHGNAGAAVTQGAGGGGQQGNGSYGAGAGWGGRGGPGNTGTGNIWTDPTFMGVWPGGGGGGTDYSGVYGGAYGAGGGVRIQGTWAY